MLATCLRSGLFTAIDDAPSTGSKSLETNERRYFRKEIPTHPARLRSKLGRRCHSKVSHRNLFRDYRTVGVQTLATVVPIYRDHLICRNSILNACYQSRVMKGKLWGRLATKLPWYCGYNIMHLMCQDSILDP